MKCDKQRYLHTISIQEKETIIMVAVSCQGDRRSTAKTNQKKIRYPLRKRCNRAALTYINATRPQGSWGIGRTTTIHFRVPPKSQPSIESIEYFQRSWFDNHDSLFVIVFPSLSLTVLV